MAPLDGKSLDLRLSDLATFLAVARFGSIHGAARGLHVSPSQVSKSVERLERKLHLNLLSRGQRGVSVSPTGRLAVPRFEAMLAELSALQAKEVEPRHQLTLVATSFLNAAFIPTIVAALPAFRVRSVELPPGVASAYAAERLFDAALTIDTDAWPRSWERVRIGTIRLALYASPALAKRLEPFPVEPERLADVPFIAPIYSYHGQVVPGEDRCPLQGTERRTGHQTQTVALALELAQQCEQLVFAPEVSARPLVTRGGLVEVPVVGWDVCDTLSLVCDGERLRAPVLKEITAALREALREPAAPEEALVPEQETVVSQRVAQGPSRLRA